MCPVVGGDVLLKRAENGEVLRIRVYQRQNAVLIAEVEPAVGIENGGGARAGAALGSPGKLAGFPFEAEGLAVVIAVPAIDVVAEHDAAAVVVLELVAFQEILLLGI